jgi:glycosyltransferase involved in cell wall biosynthesis
LPKKDVVNKNSRVAVIIPVYNHGSRIRAVVRSVVLQGFPVIVVDDGSTDDTAEILSTEKGITVLQHVVNRGKGAAIRTGFKHAVKNCDWAVTIDADGQHKAEDVKNLLQAADSDTRPLVIGCRQGMEGEHVPWTSRWGRKFSNFWVFVSGGSWVDDSQSGFRLYPLPESLELNVQARRFQFEVEVLVKAHQKGIPIVEAPVQVVYQRGAERISHFHPWKDFLRNSMTFSRLIFVRFFRGFAKK